MVKVKICGLRRLTDVQMASEMGADALGVVQEPTSPRAAGWTSGDFAEARRLLGPYHPPLVAVYGSAGPRCSADLLQVVQGDPEPGPLVLALRPEPDLDWSAVEDRVAFLSPSALVTDAWSPSQFGGTGERVSEAFVEEVFRRFSLPIVLAGGLNPENVALAIRRWRPYGVDVSSGVEAALGVKDPDKVAAFIQNAKSA